MPTPALLDNLCPFGFTGGLLWNEDTGRGLSGGDDFLPEVGDTDGGDDQSDVSIAAAFASVKFGLFCDTSLILDAEEPLEFDFEARPSRTFFRRSLNEPITIALLELSSGLGGLL